MEKTKDSVIPQCEKKRDFDGHAFFRENKMV
jgi:hypothetical protein